MKSLILIALAMLSMAGSANAACGLLADPNNPACKHGTSGPVALPAPAGAGIALPPPPGIGGSRNPTHSVPSLGSLPVGVVEDGVNGCVQRDPSGERCLIFASKRSAYEQAIQSGMEAARGGMEVQQDILRRLGGLK
jgi:hypothetical protein